MTSSLEGKLNTGKIEKSVPFVTDVNGPCLLDFIPAYGFVRRIYKLGKGEGFGNRAADLLFNLQLGVYNLICYETISKAVKPFIDNLRDSL